MMESSTLVKVGLLGGAAFLVYRYYLSPAHAAVPSPASTPAITPANSPQILDDIHTRMLAAAQAEGVGADGAGLDAWNVYLIRGGGPSPAPAPEDVFGSLSQTDRTRKYTAAEYWAGMAPYLKAKGGFAGLGFFGALCCGRCA